MNAHPIITSLPDANAPATLGIDVGGTSVKVAYLDAAGATIATGQSPAYRSPSLEELRAAIDRAIPSACTSGLPIGLCVPGATDDEGTTVTRSLNIPALNGVRIAEILPARLRPARIATLSDVYAAGFDVFRTEQLQGRLLAISLGTGVGAAVLDDGQLLRVSGRSSGHFGQWDVSIPEPDRALPIGNDGGAGSVEAYLGRDALLTRYNVAPELLAQTLRGDDVPVLALARAIRIAHAMYRPNHVRLLGGFGIRLTPVLKALRAHISQSLTTLARPGWTLGAGADDFHAARGAARFVAVVDR